MSAIDTLKSVLRYAEPALATIETIQKITGTGGLVGEEAFAAISAAIKSFVDGVESDASPTTILADLANLTKSLASDDAATATTTAAVDATEDAALAAKFPTGG